jgi:hypothetical protein
LKLEMSEIVVKLVIHKLLGDVVGAVLANVASVWPMAARRDCARKTRRNSGGPSFALTTLRPKSSLWREVQAGIVTSVLEYIPSLGSKD